MQFPILLLSRRFLEPRASLPLQQLVQRGDVGLRHLKSLEFTELPVVAETGDNVAQPVERVVQAVHPSSLARVRRQPSLSQHLDARRAVLHLLHALLCLLARVLDRRRDVHRVHVFLLVPGRLALAAVLARCRRVALVPRRGVRGAQIKDVASPLPVRQIAVISRQKTIAFRDTITLRREETLLKTLAERVAPAAAEDVAARLLLLLLLLHFRYRADHVRVLFRRRRVLAVVNVLRALGIHPERVQPRRLLRHPHAVRVAHLVLLLVSATLLVVALVELGEVEAGRRSHVVATVRHTDLLVLAIMTVRRAHATATATPGSRWLRVDFLVGPTTRIRLWATRRPVTLRVQQVVLLETCVCGHPRGTESLCILSDLFQSTCMCFNFRRPRAT